MFTCGAVRINLFICVCGFCLFMDVLDVVVYLVLFGCAVMLFGVARWLTYGWYLFLLICCLDWFVFAVFVTREVICLAWFAYLFNCLSFVCLSCYACFVFEYLFLVVVELVLFGLIVVWFVVWLNIAYVFRSGVTDCWTVCFWCVLVVLGVWC